MKRMILTIGAREYPARLTMGALLRFKRESGKDVGQMQPDSMEDMLLLIWCCVKSACRAEGIDFEMDFDAFCDSITPTDVEAWNEAMATGQEDKKKAVQEAKQPT